MDEENLKFEESNPGTDSAHESCLLPYETWLGGRGWVTIDDIKE
jgi:hypothetical protein